MNVRMVNSVFEDRRRPDFNAEANTDQFLKVLPDYAAHGIRAFTICLQGGMPGYEGALNSAFEPDGCLRESYLARAERVIEACTSGLGHGRFSDALCEVADFLLIHFNGTQLDDIPARIAALRKHAKPIVCNEDDKTGQTAARAAELCVTHGASWGLMLKDVNQYFPFQFRGAADDPVVYARFRALTSP